MKITKEKLQKELAGLQQQLSQHLANYNATNGAIQAVQGLLSAMEQPEPKVIMPAGPVKKA